MRWTDPTWREVEGDRRESLGLSRRTPWLARLAADADVYADVYADADADVYADADVDAYADVYAYAYVDAYADADADAYIYADAYAYADADAYADAYAYVDAYVYADVDADAYLRDERTSTMRSGLYAVSLVQGNLTVLRIGWFRRDQDDPDEYDVQWVTPYRGETRTRLAEVWRRGPKAAPNWEWSPPVPSVAHRFHFHPLARLDPKLWEPVVGRWPKEWGDE